MIGQIEEERLDMEKDLVGEGVGTGPAEVIAIGEFGTEAGRD